MDDRYGTDVLAAGWRDRATKRVAEVEAALGLVLECDDDGYVGEITKVAAREVELEDRHGRRRLFPLGAGYLLDGELVRLVAPAARAATARQRTASGSFAAEASRARVARAS
ncbi:MAG: DUF3097 family protein, partial [Microbacterium sp.]